MRSFVHTVQKNQMLMMTPGSLGRSNIMKSFIKQSASKTDVKVGNLPDCSSVHIFLKPY